MRKQVFGRRFKRDHNERKALFKGLMSSLILNERIKTTEEKAKAIKGQVEKLVTKARKKGESSFNQMQQFLTSDAINKLIKDVAPRFKDVNGGYTRIIKLGTRLADNASMVFIEWTIVKELPKEEKKRKPAATEKKSAKTVTAEKDSKDSKKSKKLKPLKKTEK